MGGQGGHPDPPKKNFRPSGPQFGKKITGGGSWIRHCNSLYLTRAGYRDSARKEVAPKFRLILQPATEAIKIQKAPSNVNVLDIFPMEAAVPK